MLPPWFMNCLCSGLISIGFGLFIHQRKSKMLKTEVESLGFIRLILEIKKPLKGVFQLPKEEEKVAD